MPVDLHLHTLHSDGTFTPEELVRRAVSLGLKAISITDHDTTAALAAARASAPQLEILTGIEMTASFRDRELHLLGYGFREEDPPMREHLQRSRERRKTRLQTMIDLLKERGIEITFAEVEAIAGPGASIGRPHLAQAIVNRGAVGSIDEAFSRYIGDRASCFVKGALLTVAEAARLIRQAGGVAVIAHPHRLVEESWLPELMEAGVQGIEVYHSDHNPAVTEKYRRLARERGLLATGGSDCHGFRKAKGPLIGSVSVPDELFERLKDAIASEAKRS